MESPLEIEVTRLTNALNELKQCVKTANYLKTANSLIYHSLLSQVRVMKQQLGEIQYIPVHIGECPLDIELHIASFLPFCELNEKKVAFSMKIQNFLNEYSVAAQELPNYAYLTEQNTIEYGDTYENHLTGTFENFPFLSYSFTGTAEEMVETCSTTAKVSTLSLEYPDNRTAALSPQFGPVVRSLPFLKVIRFRGQVSTDLCRVLVEALPLMPTVEELCIEANSVTATATATRRQVWGGLFETLRKTRLKTVHVNAHLSYEEMKALDAGIVGSTVETLIVKHTCGIRRHRVDRQLSRGNKRVSWKCIGRHSKLRSFLLFTGNFTKIGELCERIQRSALETVVLTVDESLEETPLGDVASVKFTVPIARVIEFSGVRRVGIVWDGMKRADVCAIGKSLRTRSDILSVTFWFERDVFNSLEVYFPYAESDGILEEVDIVRYENPGVEVRGVRVKEDDAFIME